MSERSEGSGVRRSGVGEGGSPGSGDSRGSRPADGGGGSLLSTVVLVLVILVMVWLAFSVRLPSLPELRERIEGLGWAAGLGFIGLYAVVALTPIPITVMALAGGVLFGIVQGSILSIIGVMIGCWGAYWIARLAGRGPIMRLLGSHGHSVESRLEDGGFLAVFLARVLPGLPYWPVNYGAGAFGVSQRDFLVASVLACIPGQISLVAIGHFASSPSRISGTVVVLAWAVVLGLTVWGYRRLRATATDEGEDGAEDEVEGEGRAGD